MPIQLPIPFTWKSLFKICLLVVAEGSVLALIRDAAVSLQVATIVAAIAAFAALEVEERLRVQHRHLFPATLIIAGGIWLGFIGYAVVHAVNRENKQHQLEAIYVAAEPLVTRANSLAAIPNVSRDSQIFKDYMSDIAQLDAEAKEWETKTAAWLHDNVGPVARARFLDVSGIQVYCWTNVCDQPHSQNMNRLVNEMKNLAAIRESSVYLN